LRDFIWRSLHILAMKLRGALARSGALTTVAATAPLDKAVRRASKNHLNRHIALPVYTLLMEKISSHVATRFTDGLNRDDPSFDILQVLDR
jgi:hypothetical protein